MEKHNFEPKLILIISDNRFIYDALIDNIACSIEVTDCSYIDHINAFGKVDILIIDKILSESDLILFRINILINCTNNSLSQNEIKFAKPFKLADLIETIERNQEDKNLFCCINKDWIYNQRLTTISCRDKSITLTDKENAIFQKLLSLSGHKAEKEYLLREVWNYHQSTESNTVETHLYKLKQKLPLGLLEIKNSTCYLNINELK